MSFDKKKFAEILTDEIFKIAKRIDDCGQNNCNLVHATIGVMLNKKLRKEATDKAKERYKKVKEIIPDKV